MFNSIMAKATAMLTSMVLCLGTLFGFFVPSQTKEAEVYFDGEIKNVIYLIGDGMGFEHLEKTKREKGVSLAMDTFPVNGSSRTRSFSNDVTDSAVGGTALSTGVRTRTSAVGVYPLDRKARYSNPVSLTEICRDRGMLTGIVTTDTNSGATPSAFSAHTSDRYNTDEIVEDQYASGFNIIWGDDTTGLNDVKSKMYDVRGDVFFDLQGRRIANGQKPKAKGVYIHNGKKIVFNR